MLAYIKTLIKTNIYLENQLVAQVFSIKYLGSLITVDGKRTREIEQRIGQAKTAFVAKKENAGIEKNR